jgi:hypothetical protein
MKKRHPGPGFELNIPQKRTDELQLRVLSVALRSPDDIAADRRIVFADALDRYLTGYPRRAKHRPRQDERNFWLAVGYCIRCIELKGKKIKKQISGTLSDEYAELLSIKLDATAIRKLPAQHPDAMREAKRLIKEATAFSARPYERAFLDVCRFVEIVEATKED